jgi:hypothetical protein
MDMDSAKLSAQPVRPYSLMAAVSRLTMFLQVLPWLKGMLESMWRRRYPSTEWAVSWMMTGSLNIPGPTNAMLSPEE